MNDIDIITIMITGGGTMGIILMAMWAITISQVLEKIYLYSYLSGFSVAIAGIACGIVRDTF